MAASGEAPAAGTLLRADARFTMLARPEYDIDARGIRPGTAQTLTVLGGLLMLLAPFGAWLRVTRLAAPDAEVEVVQEVLGVHLSGGSLLVVFALLTLGSASLWRRRSRWGRRTAHVLAGTSVGIIAAMLLQLQARIRDASAAAIDQAGFYDLLPGAGWGAWAGATAAGALLLASVYAALSDDPHQEERRR